MSVAFCGIGSPGDAAADGDAVGTGLGAAMTPLTPAVGNGAVAGKAGAGAGLIFGSGGADATIAGATVG